MSRNWAFLLVAITFLSIGTLAGALILPHTAEAAKEPAKVEPPRIAYVNIAKVLHEYLKANADGQRITKKRQEFIGQTIGLRDEVQRFNKEIQAATDPGTKVKLEMDAREARRKLEDIDANAQKVLTEMTDRTIVEVYQNMKLVIAELAKERGLDVVECYPDASDAKEDAKPTVAQLKLQTPALFPMFIRKELLLTEDVIERLNEKFPPGKDPDI